MPDAKVFSRDVLLISFSAFFADLGYQGVTALFPLYLVLARHAPVYAYGLITAASFGVGSLFAWLGGHAGDRWDRKRTAIAGNLFIPLMSLSGLFVNAWAAGAFFILGWWARYFRTPSRRALLVDVSPPEARAKVFGFLHALDIGGGMFSVLFALFFVLVMKLPIGRIIFLSILPLLVSTALLLLVRRERQYPPAPPAPPASSSEQERERSRKKTLYLALLAAATCYGFSFYNAGYPVLTAAMHQHSGYALGLLAYFIYLGVSALSGYALGARRPRALRALWRLGYLPSAIASLLIAASLYFHLPALAFYLFVAGLGLSMGAVETFEPTAASQLVESPALARGMGWLSVARSLGQFVSNLIMGLLFSFSQALAYGYAFAASLAATAILAAADLAHPPGGRR